MDTIILILGGRVWKDHKFKITLSLDYVGPYLKKQNNSKKQTTKKFPKPLNNK